MIDPNGYDTTTPQYAQLMAYMQAVQAQQQRQASWDAMMAGIQGPDATETAAWGNQRRQVADQYGNTESTIEFNRDQAKQNQALDTGQLAKTWDRTREALPGQFAHRNLLNSGIYGGALQQYGTDRSDASSALALKYQQQFGQFDIQHQQASNAYTSGTGQIDASEAARRQSLASQLNGVV